MKRLSKLISGLLATVLFAVTLSWVLDSTVFNAQFMKSRAQEANLYQGVAEQLPQLVTSGGQRTDDPNAVRTQELLKSVVTPEYVQNKLEPFLDSLETYLRGEGPPPVLDLTDLGRQATAAGLDVPPDTALTKPTAIFAPKEGSRSEEGPHPILRLMQAVLRIGSILALLLAGLLMLVNHGFHRLTVLAKVLLTAGIFCALAALLLRLAPNLLGVMINSNQDLGALKGPLKQLMTSMGLEIGSLLLMVAAAYGAGAIVIGGAGWHLTRTHEALTKPTSKNPRKQE